MRNGSKWCKNKIVTLVVASLAVVTAGLLFPSESNAQWVAKAQLADQTKTTMCPFGYKSVASSLVGGKIVNTNTIICPPAPAKDKKSKPAIGEKRIRAIANEEIAKRFHWGFGLGGYYLAAENPGPALKGGEGWFFGDLRVARGTFFHFQIGPGVGDIRETNPATLSEFAGLRFQISDQFSFVVGGRHRVAFLQKGELLNALMGEAQLRIRMSGSLFLTIHGAVGSSWYPYKEPAAGFYPAGAKVPIEKKPGSGKTGSLGAGLEIEF